MRRHLARENAVEDIWPGPFEAAERGSSRVAGWGGKTLYIAFRVVQGFWATAWPAVRPVGIERLAYP
jgi:hypothetical protein